MSFTDTANAKKYASIAETAAAQAKLYAGELESAPDYAAQAAASASAAASSAQEAIAAESVVSNLAISASESATSAAASAAEAGNAAAAAVGQCLRVPTGESISVLPAQSSRQDTFLTFDSSGNSALLAKGSVAILDSGGKIPVSMIPAVALSEIFVVNSQAEMLALNVQPGDIAKRTDIGLSFALASLPASTLSNWIQLNDDVLAQLGLSTGATEVGAVDDLSNPTTVQGALNLKAPTTALSGKVNTSDLSANTGATLVGTSAGITVEQAIQNAKHAIYFNAADYKTSSNTWSDAINATIQAAKISSAASNTVFIPAASAKYLVKDILVDSPVNVIGAGKLNTTLAPLNDGDTCFRVTHEFARLADFTIQSTVANSLSTGIRIEAPLVTVERCTFAFLKYCIDSPSGFGAGELDIRFNRFASSTYGVVLGGGQINTRFVQNTFNACKCGLLITEDSSSVLKTIEGVELLGDRFYACGDNTLDTAAIEIVNCRWIWLTDVMSDLATGIALRATNTRYLRLTNGYYSSNGSGNKSCVVIQGVSPEFTASGTFFSDSRNFGLEIKKAGGGVPSRPKLTNCVFQNNDIATGQQGDLVVDSVIGVEAMDCTFLANKPTGIAVINNQTGGSSIVTRNCLFYGQVFLGDSNCKFYHYDSPTHPDRQNGVATILNGSSSITATNGIISLVSGRSISVMATPSSQVSALSAGVSGANLQFTRSGTSGDLQLSYNAILIQS
ncbi:hypothetical protein [Enterobacter hormaechei]|jgi:hypothetical protein|uniref:hypothetical protein n=1 Tax=Enterobacter hormaechei TaxID=158836 RepID=UPI001BD17082|nr:hypothetical protein [Enterobacter hormaechei]DAH73798.1 MAG TPA: hypothetical protein [Caudoviricetes sp.]HCJ7383186.1 hypothetical protein [Enterobacter hormaechei subsp. xiangfangensis]